MAIHLLVVAQHASSAFGLGVDQAATLAQPTPSFQVARCGSPRELVKTVRGVASRTGQRIDVLDLFDHGLPGRQDMGDDVLFDHLGTGMQTALALRPLLTADARVRLLGCETALGPNGQALLRLLHETLGGSITVYGTTTMVEAGDPVAQDFDGSGFKKVREDSFLFSSTEAATRPLSARETRDQELREWYATLSA